MEMFRPTVLLFILNFVDAVLTIYWVRNGFASEGNHLMAGLLDLGNAPFLAVKLMVGAVTAFVLYRWGNLRIARYGLTLVLLLYIGLMGIHLFTGLTAFGVISETTVNEFAVRMGQVMA